MVVAIQLYVFGIAAMARMMHSNVLVSGLSGLGLEICKNVILAGVKSFYIHDPSPVTFRDLSSHFYANASDIKQSSSENGPVARTRAEAAFTKLKELNDLTPVQIFENKTLVCDDSGIGRFTVVVIVVRKQAVPIIVMKIPREVPRIITTVFIEFGLLTGF